MKPTTIFRITIILILGTMLAISLTRSASSQTTAEAKRTISDLGWISGDWQTASGGSRQIEEHWTLPGGGTMLGMARTIVGDKTTEFEFLKIEQRENGIFYVASPQGRPGTDFKLTRLSGTEAVFENPQHDFPKRIIYSKKADGSLVATIDAGEKTKSLSFIYLPFRK